ncbi:MAG: AMP-dependent synthetase, partial [Gemmatimonadetes bacterium]|nr:AMP-dependent synthetase [Gemmatimonadota bacterium]
MIHPTDIIGCGVDELEAAKLLAQIEALSGTPEARWREAACCILRPDHPFALHQLLYRAIYGSADGPVFFPEPADIEHAHMTALRRELGLDSHAALFAWSVAQREAFWQRTVARLGIRFHKPYTQLLDLSQGVEAPKWFVGAEMNIAESCFQAPADQTAIV